MNSAGSIQFPDKRLKYVVTLRRARIEGTNSDLPYLGLEQIEPWTGRLIEPDAVSEIVREDGAANPGESLCNSFEPGDVLFGKLRPYLAKTWLADFAGRCTTELLAMVPTRVDGRFLRYVFLWNAFIDTVNASTFGSKMPRAEWDFIGSVRVPLPERRYQAAIATFLDRQTARLDALITSKKRVVDLLREKREALVAKALISGVEVGQKTRDSGISWLGGIPAHWKTKRLAWLFRERDQRGEPNLPLLEVSISAGVVLREFSDERIESTAADFNTYKVARRGDIVFNKMRMWQGAVGVAPQDGLVSPDYVVAAPTGSLSSEYAGLLFRSPAFSAECARRSHGIVWDRLRLYWEGFREIEVPLPPQDEQARIVNTIQRATARIDEVRSATETTIALLKERRSALISDAVTGRINLGRS